MAKTYQHLGGFSDLVAAANRSKKLFPLAEAGRATRNRLRRALAFEPAPPQPREIKIIKRWERGGIAGELITWSVGYGPCTEAWLLRPAGAKGRLPGVLALHDAGGGKYFGKEKIAEGPGRPHPVARQAHAKSYGGRPFAIALARRGFAVLAYDVFLWGSRKFALRDIPQRFRAAGRSQCERSAAPGKPMLIHVYNSIAGHHDSLVGRYCRLLGTSTAQVIHYEDRVAAAYLSSRRDVQPGKIGCVGLSGGGCRAVLLQGGCDAIGCAVVVGAMFTYESLLDHNLVHHPTSYITLQDWPSVGDWSDIAACRAPSPLMVQNNCQDKLFTMAGMRAAHQRIASQYRATGRPKNYAGHFYPGPHKFDLPMQEDAFQWLTEHLHASSRPD